MSRDPNKPEYEQHDTLEMSRDELDDLIRRSAQDAGLEEDFDLSSEELADD